MNDIKVPVLSVGNWGGILLHLRGNVHGYLNAGSTFKYLRFVTGRHDLPFYYKENVELQKSFLDAFLKDQNTAYWTTKAPKVGFVVRKGNVGYNDPKAEKAYPYRFESEWPIPDTTYTKYYLTPNMGLETDCAESRTNHVVSYRALGNLRDPRGMRFTTDAFKQETEFTGHIVVHLSVSASKSPESSKLGPTEIDVFITIRHLDANGKEILYTGTVGDPVPVTKGWLRVSHRKVNQGHSRTTPWYPHRDYLSTDVSPVTVDTVYHVDIEVWPTNVVVEKGGRLVLEVSSGDTQGAGIFEHTSEEDRPPQALAGFNNIHFGSGHENWVSMPVIPPR